MVVIAAPVRVSAKVAGVVQDGVVDTSKLNARSAVALAASPVAVTVNVYEPATDGVPVRAPALESVTPVGSVEPALTAYVTASLAVRLTAVIALFVKTSARVADVLHTGSGTIVTETARST